MTITYLVNIDFKTYQIKIRMHLGFSSQQQQQHIFF